MSSFILTAVGDLVVRYPFFTNGVLRHGGYGSTSRWLQKGDMRWGSCEVQFSTRGYQTDSPIAYLVDPAVCADLAQVGFDTMTVATNHTGDFGEPAFLDTLSNLRSAGIAPVGGGNDLDEAMRPHIRRIHGMNVGVLAVSCLLPPDTAATDSRPGIAPVRIEQHVELVPLAMIIEPGAPLPVISRADDADVARLVAAIRALRQQVDFLMVSVHWGYGRGDQLAGYQRPLAHAIIEAGADMIMGNHTHSPGPIEFHQGKPVIYSLGNHIAQQDFPGATAFQRRIFADIDPWSVVAELQIGRAGVESIALRATRCERNVGLPELIESAAEARPIFEKIAFLSNRIGGSADVVIEGAVARVRACEPQ